MKKRQEQTGKIQWGKLFKKISPYTVKKGFHYLKHYGPKEFWVRIHERFEPEEIPYELWYESYRASSEVLAMQKQDVHTGDPRISIVVPAYNTPALFLRQMIDSICAQTYPEWELCIADGSPDPQEIEKIVREYQKKDPRIQYRALKENLGIAGNTNAAMEMATGEFLGLLDHDDLLAPNALYEIARAWRAHPEADVFYTDEDKVTMDLQEHFQPHLKPDFNLDLLRSNNYICHFFVVRRTLFEEVGGFRKEYDGAQDYDFIFRCTEKAGEIVHVPEILYHWRTHKASTADNPASKMYAFEAGKRAIEAHLERMGVQGTVSHTKDYGFYRVQYETEEKPLVSIIILNKDHKELLQTCVNSILEKTTYDHYEILIAENNSTGKEIFEYYKEISRNPKVRLLRWEKEFNYSAINNFAAAKARGEYLLLLNNDVRICQPDWLEELLSVCSRKEVGAVGVKLLYPDRTIQHAGVVVGMGGVAGAMFVGMPASRSGYLHKASLMQDMSAVTAACMMVKRQVYEEVHGLTEELAVAFNDVDFCLKIREKGYLVVYDPFVTLFHDESKTRGAEDSAKKMRRFQSEIDYMKEHWSDILEKGDPYYNKNLSLTKWNYSLKPLPQMEQKKG